MAPSTRRARSSSLSPSDAAISAMLWAPARTTVILAGSRALCPVVAVALTLDGRSERTRVGIRMATPAHHEHGELPPELAQQGRPRTGPVEPFRPLQSRMPTTTPMRVPRLTGMTKLPGRRVGLFFKILLGDLTLWAVFAGVLSYEVVRNRFQEQRALAGSMIGLAV